jgi:anti-sigma B factor antagonist
VPTSNSTPAEHQATLHLNYRVDAFAAPTLRGELDILFQSGKTHFIVDLSETPFMDSAGMAVLISLLRRSRQVGGDVKLIRPKSEPVMRILQLTRFDRVFEFVT